MNRQLQPTEKGLRSNCIASPIHQLGWNTRASSPTFDHLMAAAPFGLMVYWFSVGF